MLHKTPSGEAAALISNIQKYTIHDGPGIRTALFFTGCTLRCLWCSNPETIEPRQRLGFYPSKCLTLERCSACVKVCPSAEIIRFDTDGRVQGAVSSERCADCFECAEVCPPRAIKVWGQYMTVPEMMHVIAEDRSFYNRTGGGVTLNGGEVILQWEIASELLRQCKSAGIHTCVESALHVPWEHAAAVFEHTDFIIADIKHMDTEKHQQITGAGNELILANLKKTAQLGKPLVLRTPIVPGYNADEASTRKTAEFIRDELHGSITAYQLLPYRKMGTEKYESLGNAYPIEDYEPPELYAREVELHRLAELLRREYGIPAVVGADEKLER